MRGPRVILAAGLLIIGLLGAFIYLGPAGPVSRYRRFMGKDTAYYAQVARACDEVLQPNIPVPCRVRVIHERAAVQRDGRTDVGTEPAG